MSFKLFIKYLGEGYRCSNCGLLRSSTKYQLRLENDDKIAEFRLCDACQDKGYEVRFTPKEARDIAARDVQERRDRLMRKRRVKLSRRLETGLAVDVGGRTTPGSGNTKHAKDDVRVMDKWRLEHKFTDHLTQYSLKVADLAAVVRHANLAGEWPALVLAFRKLQRSFVVIPYELFLWVVEILDADPTLDRGPTRRTKKSSSEDQSAGSD
jgi:hypothetical protein